MHGDLSRNGFDRQANVDGVLHQQGRVLTDADWNEQTLIGDRWQRAAASAAISGAFAPIPSADPDALLVARASVADGRVDRRGQPGPGVGRRLARPPAVLGRRRRARAPRRRPTSRRRRASRAGTPRHARRRRARAVARGAQRLPGPAPADRAGARRRRHHRADLARAWRSGSCASAAARAATTSARGSRTTAARACACPRRSSPPSSPTATARWWRAAATAASSTTSTGSRSRTSTAGGPMFKWSRSNGGLVGRGTFDPVARKLTIRANRQPILRSGLQSFYLEAFEPLPQRPAQPAPADPDLTAELAEEWRLVYGARAVLASDEEIDLTEDLFGAMPGASGRTFFFRLWDDIRPVADFTAADVELRDGIQLQFQGTAHAPRRLLDVPGSRRRRRQPGRARRQPPAGRPGAHPRPARRAALAAPAGWSRTTRTRSRTAAGSCGRSATRRPAAASPSRPATTSRARSGACGAAAAAACACSRATTSCTSRCGSPGRPTCASRASACRAG